MEQTKNQTKKQNFIIRFFKGIGHGIKTFFVFIFFCILYILAFPFSRCKVKGKENVKKDKEPKIFITNHYQMYGPLVTFMNFPYKFRPWIIDNMMDPKKVEHQMGLMVYHEFPKVPRFIKWIILKIVKNLMVFSMRRAGGIAVSRENPRANVKAMQISTETLEKGKSVLIFPEKDYVDEGVGVFMQGFEHLAKYHYQKTGKIVSFYPMFISEINKTMYIMPPVKYNPENDANQEKLRIVEALRNAMVEKYEEVEVNNPKVQKKRAKKNKKKNQSSENKDENKDKNAKTNAENTETISAKIEDLKTEEPKINDLKADTLNSENSNSENKN